MRRNGAPLVGMEGKMEEKRDGDDGFENSTN
jgi:hypothetical protein